MSLFEDSAEDEIKRLRRLIEHLEAQKGVQTVTVEMVRKPGFGYLFYITAPTMTDEKSFGMAMAEVITSSLKLVDGSPAPISVNHVAPPRKPQ